MLVLQKGCLFCNLSVNFIQKSSIKCIQKQHTGFGVPPVYVAVVVYYLSCEFVLGLGRFQFIFFINVKRLKIKRLWPFPLQALVLVFECLNCLCFLVVSFERIDVLQKHQYFCYFERPSISMVEVMLSSVEGREQLKDNSWTCSFCNYLYFRKVVLPSAMLHFVSCPCAVTGIKSSAFNAKGSENFLKLTSCPMQVFFLQPA